MKNIKQARFVKLSFLFLAISFLMLFSSFSGKAQRVSTKCEWVWKWVWVWEDEYDDNIDGYRPRYVYRYRYVHDCVPTEAESNPTISRGRNTSHPNTVRNADGTLRPANGYQWVNSKDPNDFRVRLMPGLVKSEGGFRPDKGYRWVNPKDPKDFRVERIP